jgi:hypothetical protein
LAIFGPEIMAEPLITRLDQVTAGWLTAVLSANGALRRGSVARFDVASGQGNWSTSATLRLHYSPGAQGERPVRLFLKMVDCDLGDGESFGSSEVDYYVRDYIGVVGAPLLRCYDAHFSPSRLRYHLLLEDVSLTHVEAAGKKPTLAYGLALADGLATLHAWWWGGRRLAETGAPIHNAEQVRRFVAVAEPGAGHILAELSGELEPHWPAAIRDLFTRHPQAMIARCRDDNGFTLIHGDTGHGNILVPRAGDRLLYIVDRQPFDWSLTTWLAVYDLAYAIVLDWDVEARRQWELPILRRYHAAVLERGVRNYGWEQLFEDYRLCAAMAVYIAVEYCRGGINERWQPVWLPMLRRAMTAVDDLHCAELWS